MNDVQHEPTITVVSVGRAFVYVTRLWCDVAVSRDANELQIDLSVKRSDQKVSLQ
jgi:hypothetical protein